MRKLVCHLLTRWVEYAELPSAANTEAGEHRLSVYFGHLMPQVLAIVAEGYGKRTVVFRIDTALVKA